MAIRKRPIYIILIVVLAALLAALFGCAVFVLHLFAEPARQQKNPNFENNKPPQQTLLGGGIAVHGRHVIIYASRQQTGAASLVGFADSVLEYYAGQLGAETPSEPIHVYLLDTQADYQRADALYNNGATKRNFGFARHGNAYLYVRSRPGQPIREDSKTAFELAHELCHAIHQRSYPSYGRQPSWLKEGVANAWAEQAIIHRQSSCAGRLLAASTNFALLRQALANGQTLSIAETLQSPTNDYGSNDDTRLFVTYAKTFALIRMLDDPAPANAPRRALFRNFLKQVNTLDTSAAQAANQRFLRLFGGARLNDLQSEYIHYIQTEELCPWQLYWTDARLQEDGALMIEARTDETALVLHEQAAGASLHLRAQAGVAAVGSRQVDLVFGRSVASGFYALCYKPGYVSLLKYKDGWKFLGLAMIKPSLFAVGQHTLEANITSNRVEARLDGKSICMFNAGTSPFSTGQWGVGCYDSHITFRNISARSLADDKPANAAIHASTTASAHRTR